MSEGAMSTDVYKPDYSYSKRVQFGEGAMSTNIEKTTIIRQLVHIFMILLLRSSVCDH